MSWRQSWSKKKLVTELLRPIVADALAKGLLESTNWAAMPLLGLAESDKSDEAEFGGW